MQMISREVFDIIITDELAHRHCAPPNYLREKLAFRDLADDMANNPKDVLPRWSGSQWMRAEPNPPVFPFLIIETRSSGGLRFMAHLPPSRVRERRLISVPAACRLRRIRRS
jgi:hypothetical protein